MNTVFEINRIFSEIYEKSLQKMQTMVQIILNVDTLGWINKTWEPNTTEGFQHPEIRGRKINIGKGSRTLYNRSKCE